MIKYNFFIVHRIVMITRFIARMDTLYDSCHSTKEYNIVTVLLHLFITVMPEVNKMSWCSNFLSVIKIVVK